MHQSWLSFPNNESCEQCMRSQRGCYHWTTYTAQLSAMYMYCIQLCQYNMQQGKEKGKYLEVGWGPRRVGVWPISRSWLEVREACRGRSLACALSPSLGVLCLLAMSQPCETAQANQDGLLPLLTACMKTFHAPKSDILRLSIQSQLLRIATRL